MVPIWNALDRPDLRPDQVYLTAVAPHSRKGPHLHMKRRGLFACVGGAVTMVIRHVRNEVVETTEPGAVWRTFESTGNQTFYFTVELIGVGDEPIHIPAGIAAAIYNHGDEEALVLNMPSPAWSKEAPDEWPVEGWQDPQGWSDALRKRRDYPHALAPV